MLHIKSGVSSHTNASLNIRKTMISLLLARFEVVLSDCEEDQNPNAAGWLEKHQNNLDTITSPANDTWGTVSKTNKGVNQALIFSVTE